MSSLYSRMRRDDSAENDRAREQIFIEHGLSPDAGVRRWQAGLNPVWKHIAGGCNLARKPDDLLVSAGFELAELQLTYLPGPKPFTFTYKEWARPMNAAGPGETNLFVAEWAPAQE